MIRRFLKRPWGLAVVGLACAVFAILSFILWVALQPVPVTLALNVDPSDAADALDFGGWLSWVHQRLMHIPFYGEMLVGLSNLVVLVPFIGLVIFAIWVLRHSF